MKKELSNMLQPLHCESVNYYRNGESKLLTHRNYGKDFIYEYKTEYIHGIGNNLSGLIHSLISHGHSGETVKLYKNGKLYKTWIHA